MTNKKRNIEDFFIIENEDARFNFSNQKKELIHSNELFEKYIELPLELLKNQKADLFVITLENFIERNYIPQKKLFEEKRILKQEKYPKKHIFKDYMSVSHITFGEEFLGVAKVRTIINPVCETIYFDDYTQIPAEKKYIISNKEVPKKILKPQKFIDNYIIDAFLTPEAYDIIDKEKNILYFLQKKYPFMVIEPLIQIPKFDVYEQFQTDMNFNIENIVE